MSSNVVIHSRWVEKSGIGDIVRHFQLRGLSVSNAVGSRYFHIAPIKEAEQIVRLTRPPFHWFRRT